MARAVHKISQSWQALRWCGAVRWRVGDQTQETFRRFQEQTRSFCRCCLQLKHHAASCPTRGRLGYVSKTNNNDACDTVRAPAAPKLSARWPQSIGAGSHLFTERIDDLRPGTNEAPRASHRAYRRCACQRKIPRCGRPEFSKDRPPGLALSAPSLSSTCSMSQEAFRGSGSKAEGLSPHAAGLCQTPGRRRRPGEPLLKKADLAPMLCLLKGFDGEGSSSPRWIRSASAAKSSACGRSPTSTNYICLLLILMAISLAP